MMLTMFLCLNNKTMFLFVGVKFFVIVDHKQTATEPLLYRIYELYTDYVLKNPFYLIDMPIRCELFDQNLKKVIEQIERASAYSSATLA